MIAVDTNILVYAHRADSPFCRAAQEAIGGLVETGTPWAIPWPCVHEFFAVVTHPRVYKTPTPRELALRQIEDLAACPELRFIGETEDHLKVLAETILAGRIDGPQVHDARIAAICLAHGVGTLWSADRDFARFHRIKTKNPLVKAGG